MAKSAKGREGERGVRRSLVGKVGQQTAETGRRAAARKDGKEARHRALKVALKRKHANRGVGGRESGHGQLVPMETTPVEEKRRGEQNTLEVTLLERRNGELNQYTVHLANERR
ncbi:hypothetical protein ERJ75_001122700 [Trypanosoma vivax]|nr:hypothetical protein ERJ75_001122700 [Trypanosoma vivax]